MKTILVEVPDGWEPGKCSERTSAGWIVNCPFPCTVDSKSHIRMRFYAGVCPLIPAYEAVEITQEDSFTVVTLAKENGKPVKLYAVAVKGATK